MKKLVRLLFVCFFIIGCSKNEVPFVDLFQDNANLEFYLIDNAPDLMIHYPIRKLIVQDLIIVSDFKTDKIFHVINIKSGHYFQFGDRGRGPNEFTDGYGLASFTDTSFIVFDRMKEKISFFYVINDSIEIYQEIEVPRVNNVVPFSESLFVTNGIFPFEKNYGVIDVKQNKTYSYIDYPMHDDSFLGNQRKYYTHLVRKPSSKRLIGIKASHYMVDVLNLNDDEHLSLIDRKIYGHFEWEMNNGIPVPRDGNRNMFTAPGITGSDEKVFVCYQINNGDNQNWVLLTFDWDGNPLEKYPIPFTPYSVTSIDDSTLYFTGLFDEDYKLCKVKINSN